MEDDYSVSLNVMVVDDSAISVKKLSKLLEDLGHTVVAVARNGIDAVAMYGHVNPDIVTMDITMSQMDGIDATRTITAQYKDALIVMVTSHANEMKVIEAIQAGAVGYVIKPFEPDVVKRSIDKIVDRFMGDQ